MLADPDATRYSTFCAPLLAPAPRVSYKLYQCFDIGDDAEALAVSKGCVDVLLKLGLEWGVVVFRQEEEKLEQVALEEGRGSGTG